MARSPKRLRIRRGNYTDGASTFGVNVKVDDGEPILVKDKQGLIIGSDLSNPVSSSNPNNNLLFFKSGAENKIITTSLAYSRTSVIQANTNYQTSSFDLMSTEFNTIHTKNENIHIYVDGIKLEESIKSDTGGYIIVSANVGSTTQNVIQFKQDIPINVDLVIETICREQPKFLVEGI